MEFMKKLIITIVLLVIVFLNRWNILQLMIHWLWRSELFRDIFDEISREYIIDDYN